MDQKIVFPTGGIFIGIKRKGDANTNEILNRAFIETGILKDLYPEGKKFKGKKIDVWEVDSDFVNMLYAREKDFKLKFDVYIELDFTLQRFRLPDPRVKKKAKQMRLKLLKKIEERRSKEYADKTDISQYKTSG